MDYCIINNIIQQDGQQNIFTCTHGGVPKIYITASAISSLFKNAVGCDFSLCFEASVKVTPGLRL